MQKVLIICPASPCDMPYLRQYIDYFDSLNILYDVTFICKRGDNINYPDNYYSFRYSSSSRFGLVKKLYHYYSYSKFVVKRILKNDYTHVVTMGIACSVFLANFLKSKFKYRYIYDIRDYSQILRIPFFGYANNMLLSNSFMNVISSCGFNHWLPCNIEYTLCHNITIERLDNGISPMFTTDFSGIIRILTIGQIRDLESNTFVINQLSGNSSYELIFSGKGATLGYLAMLVNENGCSNVQFTGPYKKEEEDGIVENATFLNVCMDNNMISKYLLSNRLYLAARLKKPLISFNDCYQSEIIQKYNLGLVIQRSDVLSEKIQEYIARFNSEEFVDGCNAFLKDVRLDFTIFNSRMDAFL